MLRASNIVLLRTDSARADALITPWLLSQSTNGIIKTITVAVLGRALYSNAALYNAAGTYARRQLTQVTYCTLRPGTCTMDHGIGYYWIDVELLDVPAEAADCSRSGDIRSCRNTRPYRHVSQHASLVRQWLPSAQGRVAYGPVTYRRANLDSSHGSCSPPVVRLGYSLQPLLPPKSAVT